MRLYRTPHQTGILLGLLFFASVLFGQNQNQQFGKNRIQYKEKFDEWMFYETPNFVTFWYGASRNVAQASLQIAEYEFLDIQNLLGHQTNEKIELMVFTDLSDMKQSNLGSEEVISLRAGETKVLNNKIFVFFDGNHRHLRTQIREGIAGVLLNEMLYGSNLQEIVQNAVLLNLPAWFSGGLTAYLGEPWNTDLDNSLKDYLFSGKYPTFEKLAQQDSRLAGHAFWYYLSLHYNPAEISNFLYTIRIYRSVDRGFTTGIGLSYGEFTTNLMNHFAEKYRGDTKTQVAADEALKVGLKNRRRIPLFRPQLSPDGKSLAYIRNDLGRWQVRLKDLETEKDRRLMRSGTRNRIQSPDFNYPSIAFSPDGQFLAIAYEQRDIPRLCMVDLKTGKRQIQEFPYQYQRIFSLSFLNSKDIVVSASVEGYADLFIYRTVTRNSERLTQDFYDDLDAEVVFLDGQKGVLFSSNRSSDTLRQQAIDTILPTGNFGIYFLNLDTRSLELQRIAALPYANMRRPIALDSSHFAYLSDENGMDNRMVGYLEPYTAFHQQVWRLKNGADILAYRPDLGGEWKPERVIAFLPSVDSVLTFLDSSLVDSVFVQKVEKKRAITYSQTNFDRKTAFLAAAPRAGTLLFGQTRNEKQAFFREKIQVNTAIPTSLTIFRKNELRKMGIQSEAISGKPLEIAELPTPKPKVDSLPTYPEGWLFQVPDQWEQKNQVAEPSVPALPSDTTVVFPTAISAPPKDTTIVFESAGYAPLLNFGESQSPKVLRFNPSRIVPYRLRFRTNYFSSTVDNNLLFEGLESFGGSPQGFRQPPPGFLVKANFLDLMEDYSIEAGFRIPTTFNGTEYFLIFDNKKKRLDKRIALYRRTTVSQESPTSFNALPGRNRTNTLLGQYEVRYPFDEFMRVQATATLRQDRTFALGTDRASLSEDAFSEQRAALRLGWVFDNTVDVDYNIKNGSRARFFVEAVKKFEVNTEPSLSIKANKGFMTVIGLDARHYHRLDKRSILALRLAGGTTFGSEKILYYLGGIDNWIFPKFNNGTPIAQDQDYAFESLATNVRGFQQNIRNGNNFAVFNSELRVPIFKYVFWNRSTLRAFWRNFQVVGFADAGMAWTGSDPLGGSNPTNTRTFSNPPTVNVTVNYFRDPVVFGYGIGARAMLFGMYIRADYGWGVETRIIQKPMLFLGLGADF